jgi:hypothetical protein
MAKAADSPWDAAGKLETAELAVLQAAGSPLLL